MEIVGKARISNRRPAIKLVTREYFIFSFLRGIIPNMMAVKEKIKAAMPGEQ